MLRRIASIFLASVVCAWAQSATIPDTPAGHTLQAWLDAFNSGDRVRLTAYFDTYEPDHPEHKDRIESMMTFSDQIGGFGVIRVEKSEPLHIEALMKEREANTFVSIKLDVDGSGAHAVKQMELSVVPRPPDQPELPRLTLGGTIKALDARATELSARDRFSGAVLVARQGKIAFQKAYGLADRDKRVGNTIDTKFRIGSMNKMFTATAILQLAGEGKLDLAAPIGKYLPGYPNQDISAKVTIRQLLTHTGGTGDIFTPEYQQRRLETRELSDYLKLFGSRGLEFEPGSKWVYSNYGFILLGAVIEKVSGVSYYEYVHKHIFEPAGMHATDSLPEVDKVANRSVGYMRRNGAWANNADTLPWRGTSAGGGYSTVGDLFRFAQALSRGKLIKPELFAEMTSKQAGDPEAPAGAGYGFGMGVAEEPQGKRFGHDGGAPGMNGTLAVYPRTNTVVVVLANLDPPAATRLTDFFDDRMPVN